MPPLQPQSTSYLRRTSYTIQEQQAFVDAAVPPTLKSRFASAIKAGWKELIKELFDNSYLNMGIAILEGWQDAE